MVRLGCGSSPGNCWIGRDLGERRQPDSQPCRRQGSPLAAQLVCLGRRRMKWGGHASLVCSAPLILSPSEGYIRSFAAEVPLPGERLWQQGSDARVLEVSDGLSMCEALAVEVRLHQGHHLAPSLAPGGRGGQLLNSEHTRNNNIGFSSSTRQPPNQCTLGHVVRTQISACPAQFRAVGAAYPRVRRSSSRLSAVL
jgi:hypothetical protein